MASLVLPKSYLSSSILTPYKIKQDSICLFIEGAIDLKIDMQNVHLAPHSLFYMLEGQTLIIDRCSPNLRCVFIYFSSKFISSLNFPNRCSVVLSVYDKVGFLLNDEDYKAVRLYTRVAIRTIQRHDMPNRIDVIRHLTLALFYSIQHIYTEAEPKKLTRNEQLFYQFIQLLGQHFKHERAVRFYADKLCVSTKYLAVVVKQVSGKSALKWIDNYVVIEAKALLKSTDLCIVQICDELHFPSQSFFGKFFKRHTGMSPTEYRSS